MVGSRKYYFQPSYEHLSVPQSRWFAMTKEQRKRCLRSLTVEVSDCPNTSHSDSAVKVTLGDDPSTQLPALKTSSVSRCLSNLAFTHLIKSHIYLHLLAHNLSAIKLSVLSSKLGLSSAAIDGIPKKAAEIPL